MVSKINEGMPIKTIRFSETVTTGNTKYYDRYYYNMILPSIPSGSTFIGVTITRQTDTTSSDRYIESHVYSPTVLVITSVNANESCLVEGYVLYI